MTDEALRSNVCGTTSHFYYYCYCFTDVTLLTLMSASSWQVKNMSVPFVLVDPESGVLVWQNAASIEAIGCLGLDNSQPAPGVTVGAGTRLDYLSLLFHGEEGLLGEMRAVVATGSHFMRRMEVKR